eukprot:RCo016952
MARKEGKEKKRKEEMASSLHCTGSIYMPLILHRDKTSHKIGHLIRRPSMHQQRGNAKRLHSACSREKRRRKVTQLPSLRACVSGATVHYGRGGSHSVGSGAERNTRKDTERQAHDSGTEAERHPRRPQFLHSPLLAASLSDCRLLVTQTKQKSASASDVNYSDGLAARGWGYRDDIPSAARRGPRGARLPGDHGAQAGPQPKPSHDLMGGSSGGGLLPSAGAEGLVAELAHHGAAAAFAELELMGLHAKARGGLLGLGSWGELREKHVSVDCREFPLGETGGAGLHYLLLRYHPLQREHPEVGENHVRHGLQRGVRLNAQQDLPPGAQGLDAGRPVHHGPKVVHPIGPGIVLQLGESRVDSDPHPKPPEQPPRRRWPARGS